MLGSNCLVSDLESIVKANDLCNRLGIDTISAGAAIAFAMELFELGIIGEKDIGFPLQWGDGKAMVKMVMKIGLNKGFGKVLGQGVKKAAQLIGKDSYKYAIHVKGLEVPAHDPRAFKGIATEYATSNRGACHLAGMAFPWERSSKMPELGYEQPLDRFTDKGKGKHTAKFQDLMTLADSLLICKYSLIFGLKISEMIEALNYITGWDVNFKEFMKTGDRIYNLKRLFNTFCGISRKDDILPDRILNEPRKTGGAAKSVPNLKKQLDEYYTFRKWDSEGIPQEEKLKELDLEEFINQ
jgi:aldehyde:ferredoxin oxidoreductase